MLVFKHGASAGSQVTYITEGNFVFNLGNGGLIIFENGSSARKRISLIAGMAKSASGGRIIFNNNANAGHSTITNEGAAVDGAAGGFTSFDDTAGAGNALIVTQGGTVPGGKGGWLCLPAPRMPKALLWSQTTRQTVATARLSKLPRTPRRVRLRSRSSVTPFEHYDVLQPTAIGSLEGDGEVLLAKDTPCRSGATVKAPTFLDGSVVAGT